MNHDAGEYDVLDLSGMPYEITKWLLEYQLLQRQMLILRGELQAILLKKDIANSSGEDFL